MFDRDSYSDNLPDDFQKVNEGVPSQIGQGQVTPDAAEKAAQSAQAEEESKTSKPKKKGRK